MDLAEYERAKFELADILRGAEVALSDRSFGATSPFHALFTRLAEDRFNLALVGRFSRGKTSVMNAILETDRLPTGVIPLTSVITAVRYGSIERALIEHEGWQLTKEIPLEQLPDYITQQRNPGNQRGVVIAHIELPSELLRRGFHLIDTPGLGSSIIANTRTTEKFLPEADAFMLVTSYDSPLSEDELGLLRGIVLSSKRIFLVVNKHDIVSSAERRDVLQHIRDQTSDVFAGSSVQIFSVSAREATEAFKAGDRERLLGSGIPTLKSELIQFLLGEKQNDFLLRMCERVTEALQMVSGGDAEIERLDTLRRHLTGRDDRKSADTDIAYFAGTMRSSQFSSCRICSQIERATFDWLCKFQHDIGTLRDVQITFANSGGLCPAHTWQYEAVASPHGTCLGFPTLLNHLVARLREIAAAASSDRYVSGIQGLCSTTIRCPVCRISDEAEVAAVINMTQNVLNAEDRPSFDLDSVDICIHHLARVIDALDQTDAKKKLVLKEAAALERLSEDMRRYAIKHDGTRRHLASKDEVGAHRRALMMLAGHRKVVGL